MYIETWQHFINFIDNMLPWLDKHQGLTFTSIRKYAVSHRGKYSDIPQFELDTITKEIEKLRDISTGEVKEDLIHAWWFIWSINRTTEAKNFKTWQGCQAHDYYWWGNACHIKPEEETKPKPPPEPEPDPPYLPPEHFHTQSTCTAAHYFWYENKCHENMGTFMDWSFDNLLLDIYVEWGDEKIKGMVKKAEDRYEHWVKVLSGYPDWVWDAAMQEQALKDLVDMFYTGLTDWAGDVQTVIGDVTKLNSKSIIDTIMEIEAGTSGFTDQQAKTLIDFLDISFTTDEKHIGMLSGGFLNNIYKVTQEFIDDEGNISIPTFENIQKVLKDDYSIVEGSMIAVEGKAKYAYDEVKAVEDLHAGSLKFILKTLLEGTANVIGVVTGEIESPIWDESHPLQYIIPASQAWVLAQLEEWGDVIFEGVEEVTKIHAKALNAINDILSFKNQEWIDELKSHLGL